MGTCKDHEKLANTSHNRAINRHRWDLNQLTEQLSDTNSDHSHVLTALTHLINIRTQQIAFHPNATQFTLHLGLQLFGFWRQSRNRKQSIFCISNVSDQITDLPINELNLIIAEYWVDLLTGQQIEDITQPMQLQPYQTVWISN